MESVKDVRTSAYVIPTEVPESDGTLSWDHTTLVLVEIKANGKVGNGYTYADPATAYFIDKTLKPCVLGADLSDIPAINKKLKKTIRNQGNKGIAMMAVSAVDNALWDLKGKILDLPVAIMLGKSRDDLSIYGSGGFTSYSDQQMRLQFEGWLQSGITSVKMKVGRNPERDSERVKAARQCIGANVELFVDANGAYTVKEAMRMARLFDQFNVSWFEEPVSSENIRGLCFIKDKVGERINVVAGEYGYSLSEFREFLENGAVDILQADATRCGGISDYLKVGYLAEFFTIPFSSHCAPLLHAQVSLTLPSFLTAEYFHDHVRIEEMLFDNSANIVNGRLHPDLSRPGLGLIFKHADAEKFKI
ncbi:MAG TPA: enolase C-terminal domain-like protein [Cyclobacteriaceae bacterium]|nr:enolase C-terminal domain-like protein [Cyclobacteriaceae bacterium]